MADVPIQFQPGDQVALLDGSSPMMVKTVKDGGRTVTCVSTSEDNPSETDYDATKLTKLHSGTEPGTPV